MQRGRDQVIRDFVEKAMTEQPETARKWVISTLTEFSDEWWDELTEVLRKIRNKEIGPYAGVPDQGREEMAPGSPEAVAEAEALYESSSGFVRRKGSSAWNTTEESAG